MANKVAPKAMVPFVRAAHKLTQPAFNFTTPAVLGAAVQDFGPFDIPSGGYLRSILLEVTCTGGVLAPAGALAADAPWNIIRSVELADVNGQALVNGNIQGYDLFLMNIFGAYAYCTNPLTYPDYTIADAGNPVFYVRVPVEIDHTDGYGALPNLNAAEPYRMRVTINTGAAVYGVAPGTYPSVTVRAWSEDWSLPSAEDGLGNPQQVSPPDMNTTQYWSKAVHNVVAGQQTIRLTRTGNLVREVICVARNAAGARVTADYPNDLTFTWDRYQLYNESRAVRRLKMTEKVGLAPAAVPAGVFVYDYTEDGSCPGGERRNLWIPTMQPTRLDLNGTFGATANTLEIITNDVAASGGR